MEIIERESIQEMKSISQEFISDIATLKLTREALSAIIGSHMEFTADLKFYYKLLKNDRKLIHIMIRWKLKPKIRWRGRGNGPPNSIFGSVRV
jgi:hypothetical protein